MQESIHYIYLLICPISNDVKYVGVTMNPKSRFNNHLNRFENKSKKEWIHLLKSQELKPIMKIVENCATKEIAIDSENIYIEKYRTTILNSTRKNNFPSGYNSNYKHK